MYEKYILDKDRMRNAERAEADARKHRTAANGKLQEYMNGGFDEPSCGAGCNSRTRNSVTVSDTTLSQKVHFCSLCKT
jgi:hypothetical protein